MAGCQDILAIPAKKQAQPGVNHLTVEQTRRLLAQPDRSTRRGRRDATLLATLYDTAARVQEFADLTVRDIRLATPCPGRADRQGPQDPPRPARRQHRSTAGRLPGRTRPRQARPRRPPAVHQPASQQTQPRRHRLDHRQIPGPRPATRHSPAPTSARTPYATRKAMHLYEAGVPLPYIRDILGHVDLATTEIYARASTEAKRKALEATYTDIVTDDLPEWNHDPRTAQLARQPVSSAHTTGYAQ